MTAEWIVIRLEAGFPDGYQRYQTDGKVGPGLPKLLELGQAQAIQGQLNRGADERIASGAEPPVHGDLYWRINHYVTLNPPHEHQAWLNVGGKIRLCEHCGNPVRP